MKRNFYFLCILLCALLINQKSFAQASASGISYTISNPATAYVANAGTVIHAANTDDAISAAIPITFAFKYGGISVTQIWVSSNGFISFANPGGSLPAANLGNTSVPTVAPLWDNLKCGSAGNVNYKFTGANPTRVMTIEWLNMNWDVTGAAASPTVSFQIKLYQDSTGSAVNNFIDFIYRQEATAPSGAVAARNANIGLAGWCAKDYYSATTANVNVLSKTAVTNINARPATNTRGRFIPVSESNNICTSAQLIPWSNVAQMIFKGSTLQSDSNEIGPPPHTGVCTPLRNDVWFTFTKAANITNFEIGLDSTCFSTTQMEVYTSGAGCGAGMTLVGCYTAGMAGFASDPYVNLTGQPCAATTYYVRVQSDNTTPAYFRLVITPPGRDCAFANNITPCGVPYTVTNFSAVGFVNDYDSTTAVSHSPVNSGDDYLFTYTPVANQCVNFSVANITPNRYPGLFIYAGCANSGNLVAFSTPGNATSIALNNITLGAGITYYFMIENDSAAASPVGAAITSFDFSVTASASLAPANDACAGAPAITVTVGASCVGATNYTTACANPSAPSASDPACAGFISGSTGDVWFTYTAGVTQVHQVNIDPGTSAPIASDIGMAVYTSASGCAGPFTLISCDDNSNGFNMPSLAIASNAGTTYYIRVWSANATQPGTFRICVLRGCTPPNDFCASAVPLALGVSALNQDNACSSSSSEPLPTAGCTSAPLNTVWYSVVCPASGQLKIKTRLRSLTNSYIALFQSCAGPMITCNDDAPACSFGVTRNSEIVATGLIPGNTYYISVDGQGANTGTFDIMAIDGTNATYPPISEQDCQLPTTLCSSNIPVNVANPGYQGVGNNCDLSTGTCLASAERGSSWYTFSTATGAGGGTLNFTIAPNDGTTDYDFQLWEVTGLSDPCNLILTNPTSATFPFRSCNYSAIGTTGLATPPPNSGFNTGQVLPPNDTNVYILIVSNFTNSTSGFSLSFGASPIAGQPATAYWDNATTSTWSTIANWTPNSCMSSAPDCNNQISAVISSTAPAQPIIPFPGAPVFVKNITISPGATLTLQPGATMFVCGDFINNGNLVCGANSNIIFTGSAVTQIIQGSLTGANAFFNFKVAKSSGTVRLMNNFEINGYDSIVGGIFDMNGRNVTLGGNFYNYNGATSHVNGTLTSTMTFDGAANQSWNNNVSAFSYYNVVMAQSPAATLNIVDNGVASNLTIVNQLTLTDGTITTGVNREVSVTTGITGAVNAGDANSYVNGNLRRLVNAIGTYEFPVGNVAQGYERFSIQYTSLPSPSYTLLAKFRNWAPPVGPAVTECVFANWSLNPMLDHGYWTLDASIGSPTGTYNARAYPLAATNVIGVGTPSFSIAKSPSSNGAGAFAMNGTCVIPGTSLSPVVRNAMSGFSDFAITQFNTPLPIELLSFSAEKERNGILCSWSTASEINNEYFDVERSFDGNEFTKIGARIPGAGNSSDVHYYSLLDKDPCDGVQYYRLRQVDFNGHFTYSDVVAVNCKIDKGEVSVFPNPANTEITYTFYESTDGEVTIEFVDMVGKVIQTSTLKVTKGYNTFKTKLDDFSDGVYYIKIRNSNFDALKQVKFLKY